MSSEESSDAVTYKRHTEYMKNHPTSLGKIAVAIKLMGETRSGRIAWIKESKPQVPAILLEFPYLRNNKIVMEEFKQMTGIANSPDDVMALKWNQLQPRILAYAMLLNRTCLRDLLDKVKEKDIPNECLGILAFQITNRMLNRFKASEKFIIDFIEQGTDIDRAIEQHGTNPYILCTGDDIYHVDQFITVVEKVIVNETGNLWKAIASMTTWYYIVDIVYPPECANTLLFIEKVLLNIPMSSKMNNSAIQIISAIEHLDMHNL